MSSEYRCRCCLARPPDRDLKSPYTLHDKTEVYANMLKECFEINLTFSMADVSSGICEVCIARLRDATDFKHQVQQCQKDLQDGIRTLEVKVEVAPTVKQELLDVEDLGFDLMGEELKQEFPDLEELDEDDRKLADLLTFTDVAIKKKPERKTKRTILKADGKERPIKISLRTLTKMSHIKGILSGQVKGSAIINSNIKHKTNVANIIKYSNCTPFFNKTLSGIVCAYCKETCQGLDELRTHVRTSHENEELVSKKNDMSNLSIKVDITDLKCRLCEESFSNISTLKLHLTKCHEIKFYPDCNDYILEFKLTSTHMLNCALCHSSYETFKMLLQHMNGHYRNYVCDVCNLGFINRHRLRNHQRTHEVGSFKCSFCDKVFSTRVRLMSHEKYIHKSSNRYTTNCPHCDKSFNSYYQRNRHMYNEHNIAAATYRCNICDKSFILKSKLTSHVKKVHLMERNHICPECGQGFFIKQSLDEHMIKHNGERVFKCTVCLKAYARKKTLREHMRIHNNDRRFKCGVCTLAFVQKCSLKSHMLSNHGVALSEYETAKVCT